MARAVSGWLVAVALIAAIPAAASGSTGIKGEIVDMSCPGPCVPEETGHPFGGTADVVVRRVSTDQLVRRLSVDGSTFKLRVRRGRYSVEAIPYPDQTGHPCWIGSTERVRVKKGRIARVELTVRNNCLL